MNTLMTCCMLSEASASEQERLRNVATKYRATDPAFAEWSGGYGVISHDDLTQVRIGKMVSDLVATGKLPDSAAGYRRLRAADLIANAGMWLVVHMTYARRVRLEGTPLLPADFKSNPEGHTGGSLNMVLAYTAYLAMNAMDGVTRSWMMGQGHCVAAIDALNAIVGNMTEAHAGRYGLSEEGLSRLVADFYSFAITPDGRPAAPLGSHVNAFTAGGTQEGGYLGFMELHYAHAPLPGERLVAFLSDGAFEEQRGSDWAPRWWRPADTGLIAPIMILNGRRIEQRTQIDQMGGESWLHHHLRLNGFEPIGVDGRDPASIAWGIHTIESRLLEQSNSPGRVDVIPYAIAQTVKGFGFPGAGTNRAHNLPLPANPFHDARSRDLFNEGATQLHVPVAQLRNAVAELATHKAQNRPLERDHPIAVRNTDIPNIPPGRSPQIKLGRLTSPMAALDESFCEIVKANPHLRPRVGNPDELRSNRLDQTLDLLKHRVLEPGKGIAESTTGVVITALNEEAVVCAALGNKGGLNLVVTYEAFAPKMLGAIRQEITFSQQLALAGRPAGWLSVPIVVTSHTWENSKNEISHQDPTLAEVLLGEMADAVSVVFPPDANTAVAALGQVYQSKGRIVLMVVPKRPVAEQFSIECAKKMSREGLFVCEGSPATAQLIIAATGAYQLAEARAAYKRLGECGIASALIYIYEPGRLRSPRDQREEEYVLKDDVLAGIFPPAIPRIIVTHTRPEPFLGALRRIDTGPCMTRGLGFINHGGTLDVEGMIFANRSSWAHIVVQAADLLGLPSTSVLTDIESAAVEHRGDPALLWRVGSNSAH